MQDHAHAWIHSPAKAQTQGWAKFEDQVPFQDSGMRDDASIVSGLSVGSCEINPLVFLDIEEDEVAKLKTKSVPKRKSGVRESFVVLWAKANNEVTPQKNL